MQHIIPFREFPYIPSSLTLTCTRLRKVCADSKVISWMHTDLMPSRRRIYPQIDPTSSDTIHTVSGPHHRASLNNTFRRDYRNVSNVMFTWHAGVSHRRCHRGAITNFATESTCTAPWHAALFSTLVLQARGSLNIFQVSSRISSLCLPTSAFHYIAIYCSPWAYVLSANVPVPVF